MLNLVQLQERLKDVPMQALMQYANGGNPQVPPFLALGELNRRKKMQEGAAAEQAKEMEGAPTVKQQIEQAAGLMALQGNRQKQAAQQQQQVQSAMPMAAPNTTTSEPAQLAGGGFIDDIVVPRDYQAGGVAQGIDPEMIKRLMLRRAMQGKPAAPEDLQSAVKSAMMRRAKGVAGLPVGNMFKREDYAGGGIVAFQTGDLVQDIVEKETRELEQGLRQDYSPEAKRIMSQQAAAKRESEAKYLQTEQQRMLDFAKEMLGRNARRATPTAAVTPTAVPTTPARPDENYSNEGRAYERGRPGALDPVTQGPMAPRMPDTSGIERLLAPSGEGGARTPATPKTTPEIEFLRKLYNQATPDYEAELKKRGLDVRPQAGKTIEELKRQREEIKGEDTFANRLLSLTPGRRFGTGETGKGLMAFEKAQSDKLRQIGLDISKAEDLEAKADYEFRRGNFDKAQTLKTEADKAKADAAKSAGTMGVNLEQIAAQREGTAAQREATAEGRRATNMTALQNAESMALARDPNIKVLADGIKKLQEMSLMNPLTPAQKTQLESLQAQLDKRVEAIKAETQRQMAAQGGAGGFRVIGVKPSQ